MRRTRYHRPLIVERAEDFQRLQKIVGTEPEEKHDPTMAILLLGTVSLLMIVAAIILVTDMNL